MRGKQARLQKQPAICPRRRWKVLDDSLVVVSWGESRQKGRDAYRRHMLTENPVG